MMEGPMGRVVLLNFLLFLFASTTTICQAKNKITHFEVIGNGECADCAENNIHTVESFAGLHVTIECLSGKGETKRKGVGKLDKEGKFKVTILDNEGLKEGEECYARLQSASKKLCPTHNELKSSKIVFKQESNGKQVFSTFGKLRFSTTTCVSAFWWPPYYYHPLPKLPPLPAWKKPFPPFPSFPPKVYPPIYFPPKVYPPVYFPPKYTKPLPPPVPVYEKPLPPPVPVYEPPVPVYKPKPPAPVPVYKPKPPAPVPVPVYKPKPPAPVPVYKPKPPAPVPEYKPKPPAPVPEYKPKPPVPVYEPKPIPPSIPIYKKPCPPIIIPSIPPKYFNHPKYPLPPYPPYASHP
ncbi:proline-rich protein 4-like isoform X3 [Impatiens glandulifera]|uniref:proline-rich protein 4-like isoform X3 n=1 Tax=Impatiens glandulifera TaxID=253017 RepID=UPI001FB17C02|nr:proline-rich protein 4-like isoform X3 [Impatiens glandulifera]